MPSFSENIRRRSNNLLSKSRNMPPFKRFLQILRNKFGLKDKEGTATQQGTESFHDLHNPNGSLWTACCQIASIQTLEQTNNHNYKQHQESLRFTLRHQLNSTTHELRLPTPVGSATEAGEGGVFGESLHDFISQLPENCRKISKKADPSGLVARLLPVEMVSKEARFVGSAFWLWLCAIDDLTENLSGESFKMKMNEIYRVFNNEEPHHRDADVVTTSRALLRAIFTTRICCGHSETAEYPWRLSFIDSIKEILHAFEAEKPLQATHNNGHSIKITEWMNVRIVTISARPFMILAKASLGLAPHLSDTGYTLQKKPLLISPTDIPFQDDLTTIEVLAQCIMGLQNDILGWEKDHQEGNILNAIEIYIHLGMDGMMAMTQVTAVHNWLVDHAMALAFPYLLEHDPSTVVIHQSPFDSAPSRTTSLESRPTSQDSVFSDAYSASSLCSSTGSTQASSVEDIEHLMTRKYVELLMNFIWSMAKWTSSSKRYAA